jgi:hypothetical protein
MHRASPTLLVLAAFLTGSLLTAAPVHADESPSPAPVTASPSPMIEAAPSPSASTPATPDVTPSPSLDVLVSVNVVMAAQTAPGAPSLPPPRARLPLRKGHYGYKTARLQERLAWLGYDIDASNTTRQAYGGSTVSAVKAFQAKNWLDPTGVTDKQTWVKLARMAEPIGILPLRCTEVKTALCIDKTTRTLRYVVHGKVKLLTDARFGAPGMETGEGLFTIKEKSFNHVSSLYDSWMPRAMFFNGDEAVHYSPDFASVGYLRGSHGCVGIRDMDLATELFEKVAVGTRVYVYWS